ncbi:gamma-glutamylcyclotransferase family protein [Nocardia farcinica]|uniref:gamma-glutamylcyclotransferase family protein n=1 Tax=Nocardia farcinica TaxID=37329 RepID=UPI0018951E16|nr:gamma-glutamylcyclotransferase family protein [Nocardia farcinica]MBF6444589.1 gamma-glutamylcyclotransferase [Nocardia farcinica]
MPSPSELRVHAERFDVLGDGGERSDSTEPLFAYGTLQLEPVLRVLIGRIPQKLPAEAVGWRVVRLPGKPYPGLVRDAGRTAVGQLITGLTPQEWMLLDRFEDGIYRLDQVTTVDGRQAWAYVWPDAGEDADWTLASFSDGSDQLREYVERCTRWLERDRSRGAGR